MRRRTLPLTKPVRQFGRRKGLATRSDCRCATVDPRSSNCSFGGERPVVSRVPGQTAAPILVFAASTGQCRNSSRPSFCLARFWTTASRRCQFRTTPFTNDGVAIRLAGNSKVIYLSLMPRRGVSFGNREVIVNLVRTVPAMVLWLALWGCAFWLPPLVELPPRRTSAHGMRFCITRLGRHRTEYSGRSGRSSIL